jgi:metal-responsive CopG/Arc/MetJ family transcriptional regulator
MIRTDIYLTSSQVQRLDEDKGGKSRSELIRRIIDNYYELKDKKENVENDKS